MYMLIKTDETSKTELSYRPINNPQELQEVYKKTEKIDIVITFILYAMIAAIAFFKVV